MPRLLPMTACASTNCSCGAANFATRSRARDAIERRAVRVEGEIAPKPGQSVRRQRHRGRRPGAALCFARRAEADRRPRPFRLRSRAAAIALDIGASTGGFTQVLLRARRGACQRHRCRPRPDRIRTCRRSARQPDRGLNARDLDRAIWQAGCPDFIVCDVSFISLRLALPPALALAAPGARAVFLVKPQFEAGRAAIGKGGMLQRSRRCGRASPRTCAAWLEACRAGGRSASARRRSRRRRQPRIPARRDQGPMSTRFTIARLGAQGDGVAETEPVRCSCPSRCRARRSTADARTDRADAALRCSEPSPLRVEPACRHFGDMRRLRHPASRRRRLRSLEARQGRAAP